MTIKEQTHLEYPLANFSRMAADVVQEVHDWVSDKLNWAGRHVDQVTVRLAETIVNKNNDMSSQQMHEHIKGSMHLLAKIVLVAASIVATVAIGSSIFLIGAIAFGAHATYKAALAAEKAWVGGDRLEEIVTQAAKAFFDKGVLEVALNAMWWTIECGIETSEEVQHAAKFCGALGKLVAHSFR